MKLLITQAKRSDDIGLLREQIKKYEFDIAVFPEGYIGNETLLENCCHLARAFRKPIISSYLEDIHRKDMAVVIDQTGSKTLCRIKSSIKGPLLEPSKTIVNNKKIGYMLCCEIFLDDLDFSDVEIIFNPIGVGMFSEEQFVIWSSRARALAERFHCYVIGVSHADGSYKNCGTSIPIGYVFDKDGNEVYLSKADTRSVIVDLAIGTIIYLS